MKGYGRRGMDNALKNIWAKTDKSDATRWHPLILHMLDVAASADAILAREPETTRKRIAKVLGLEWETARGWILLVVACHDLGKACPGFQCKWSERLASTGLRLPRSPNTDIHHAFVSQIALSEWLQERGWPEGLAELVSDAVGCHHGERASENAKDRAVNEIYVGRGERLEAVRNDWAQARRGLIEAIVEVLRPVNNPAKQILSGPDFMLLSGLTSFADWIGSNEDWFPFGSPDDCEGRLKLDSLKIGQRFRFRLRANPCVTRNGKRLGLLRLEEQEKWIERKAGQHGFSLSQLASYDQSASPQARLDIRISQEQMLRGKRHAGNGIRIYSVLYDGILMVSEAEKFRAVLETGIGHGKVMGLGLLSVAPIA